MWLSLIVCCVFSIGNWPRRNRQPTVAAFQFPLSQYYCHWVPAMKKSWCAIHQSSLFHLPPVLHQSSLLRLLQVHHSKIPSVAPSTSVAPILTVAPSTVAPFYGVAPFVSYHFVPCDYATRQFYIINNLATDVNTPCRLFNCIDEIQVLATTEHVATCRRIYSTVLIQLH